MASAPIVIAVDTDLLVYAHRSAVLEHRRARRAIEGAANDARGWGISAATIGEFCSIVTHPEASGRPSSPEEAAAFLRSLAERAGMQVWMPGTGFADRLLQLAIDLEVSGARIFDLQIALTAFEQGAVEIWSHDRNFVRLPGMRVRDPL